MVVGGGVIKFGLRLLFRLLGKNFNDIIMVCVTKRVSINVMILIV